MLWTHDDSGYLVAVDISETGRCPMCGTAYIRAIENRKSWQSDGPDTCPCCGHPGMSVPGIAFVNRIA